MKKTTALARLLPLLATSLALPVHADVIYSGLQDLPIPKTLDGLYLNVITGSTSGSPGTWHINPTFGGIDFYNSNTFQPVRVGTAGNDTIRNLAQHTLVSSSSSSYATGFGVSDDHMGNTFTAGQEGYIGFSVVNGSDTDYGWMRVVFTGTGSPVVKDWAYNTGGASIGVGNVIQSGSTYTLDSTAQSFTLGSSIGGANSIIITGSNTATLSGVHGFSGSTTINSGTLALAGGASISNTSTITVGTGTTLDVSAVSGGWTLGAAQTLTGSGGVNGNTTIAGTHNAGTNGVGSQAFTGNLTYAATSIFAWDLNDHSTSSGFDTVSVTGSLTVANGAAFHVKLGTGVDLGNAFWDTNRTWSNLFTYNTGDGWLATTTVTAFDSDNNPVDLTGKGSFSVSGGNLSWSAVPEPSTALTAILLTFGILRRRRI